MNQKLSSVQSIHRTFILIYILTSISAGVYAYYQQNFKTVEQAGFSLILLLIPSLVYKLFRLNPLPSLSLLVRLFCYLAYVMGVVLRLYQTTVWFDKFVHLLSGILFSLIGFGIYYFLKSNPVIEKQKDFHHVWFFSLCFSMAVAAFWEMGEYAGDYFFGMNLQHAIESGANDTMQDIYACFLGTILFLGLLFLYMKKNKRVYPCTIVEDFVQQLKTRKKMIQKYNNDFMQ